MVLPWWRCGVCSPRNSRGSFGSLGHKASNIHDTQWVSEVARFKWCAHGSSSMRASTCTGNWTTGR